uniref:Uncharacterized protein n=1 Tax=Arundo donax TaxID=35708 RepID=A0A0A8XWL3_ARUDO
MVRFMVGSRCGGHKELKKKLMDEGDRRERRQGRTWRR